MSSMNNLDLMIGSVSKTPEDYDEYKTLASEHLNGNVAISELPLVLRDVFYQWESEEMELGSYHDVSDEEINAWEDY